MWPPKTSLKCFQISWNTFMIRFMEKMRKKIDETEKVKNFLITFDLLHFFRIENNCIR